MLGRLASLDLAGFLIRLLVNAVGLAVAAWVLPGITVANGTALLVAALIFGVVNALAKPVLVELTCPLILLTLGLFLLIVHALLLGLTSWIAGRLEIGFHVDGFGAAVLGSIVISIVSWLLNRFTD